MNVPCRWNIFIYVHQYSKQYAPRMNIRRARVTVQGILFSTTFLFMCFNFSFWHNNLCISVITDYLSIWNDQELTMCVHMCLGGDANTWVKAVTDHWTVKLALLWIECEDIEWVNWEIMAIPETISKLVTDTLW